MSKLILGVGINDANYVVEPRYGGVRIVCPYYKSWSSILTRCYSEKYQKRKPTYKGCSVTEEWLTFSNFRSWMITQDWEGKHLDKDLIIEGNKIYGPETCIFVNGALNSLLTNSTAARGDLPLGVTKLGRNYQARVGNEGRLVQLGTFKTPEAAHIAWRKAKSKIIMESAITQQDNRVFIALIKRAKNLLVSPHQFV